ncbi:ankyrin repeat domain-containing protein [Kocuria sp. HSID16901]|uniref:ankyrin repeat domain-containing protein n=1 Tax=Kocuria sp. HSID16901 TaxID=2419505 RepID=UPI00066106C0|nr:ankyrin repeat domain-containing protein [Kocuria sp. HSID16901]RUQ21088.1 ankyrin repeat domain-containing protein [Kocuria sp. HSID16901]
MTDSPQNSPELTDEELALLHHIFDMARDGQVQELQSALNQGVPVNLTNSRGDTLLILAAYREQPEVVSLLIERGADLDRLNDRGQSALVSAVFRNRRDIAEALLDAGADATIGSQTPAAVAEFFDIEDMKTFLSERGIR